MSKQDDLKKRDLEALVETPSASEKPFDDEELSSPLKVSLSDKVADRLRDAIYRGKLAPGEQMREMQLSQWLGVSRGPVREALQRLEREGLVIIPRNGRSIVARLTREDFDEVYSLRLGLEQVAMQYVIRNATPAELDEMQQAVEMMVRQVNAGISEKEAADLDLQFHDLLYRASRHKRLQGCWADLRPQIYIFLLSRNVADQDFRAQMIGHQEIVDVIRAGDEETAMKCIRNHIAIAYARIIKTYSL